MAGELGALMRETACKPISKRKLKPRNVHITRLRRFAGKDLKITQQIQTAIDRDFPDNEVQQIIDHKTNKADGELHLLVQWLGFTKAERTWEPARSLHEYVPGHVRAYTHDHKQHAGCQNSTMTTTINVPRGENRPKIEQISHV